MAPNYSSNFDWLWSLNTSPNLLIHAFVVCTVTDSKCTFKLTRLWPPSVSSISHNFGFQVQNQNHLIRAAKYTWSLPPSLSSNSGVYGLQLHRTVHWISVARCISNLPRLQSPSVSLTLLHHGLHAHLCIYLISSSMCISKLTQFWPPNTSPSLHGDCLQPHIYDLPNGPPRCFADYAQVLSGNV
jgi:hypothetical protein